MAKASRQKNQVEKVETCTGCPHYSYDVQKTSLPVMRNKVFYKVTMKCHSNNALKVLNEKYEDNYPTEERLLKLAPKKC